MMSSHTSQCHPVMLFSPNAKRIAILNANDDWLGVYDVASGHKLWKRPFYELEEEFYEKCETGDDEIYDILKSAQMGWAQGSTCLFIMLLDQPELREMSMPAYDDFTVWTLSIDADQGTVNAGPTFCPSTHISGSALQASSSLMVHQFHQSTSPDGSLVCIEVSWVGSRSGLCHFVIEAATGSVLLKTSHTDAHGQFDAAAADVFAEESELNGSPAIRSASRTPCWAPAGSHVTTGMFLDNIVSRQSLRIDVGEGMFLSSLYSTCFRASSRLLGCTVSKSRAAGNDELPDLESLMGASSSSRTVQATFLDVSTAAEVFAVKGWFLAAFATMHDHALLMKPNSASSQLWDMQQRAPISSIQLECSPSRMSIEFGINDRVLIGGFDSQDASQPQNMMAFMRMLGAGCGEGPKDKFHKFAIFDALTGAVVFSLSDSGAGHHGGISIKQSPDGLSIACHGNIQQPSVGAGSSVCILRLPY